VRHLLLLRHRTFNRVVQQPLSDLSPVTADEVAKIIQRSPAKQCQADPVLTWLVKRASDILAPVIAAICNSSFQQVTFPQRCKKAIVRPLPKKSTMNPQDPSSCRSISNLSFLSKVIEKVVDSTFSEHIDDYHLLPIIQSAYRPYHSTSRFCTRFAITEYAEDISLIFDRHNLHHDLFAELLRWPTT